MEVRILSPPLKAFYNPTNTMDLDLDFNVNQPVLTKVLYSENVRQQRESAVKQLKATVRSNDSSIRCAPTIYQYEFVCPGCGKAAQFEGKIPRRRDRQFCSRSCKRSWLLANPTTAPKKLPFEP